MGAPWRRHGRSIRRPRDGRGKRPSADQSHARACRACPSPASAAATSALIASVWGQQRREVLCTRPSSSNWSTTNPSKSYPCRSPNAFNAWATGESPVPKVRHSGEEATTIRNDGQARICVRQSRRADSRNHQNTQPGFRSMLKETRGHHAVELCGASEKHLAPRRFKPRQHGLEEMHVRVLFALAGVTWQNGVIAPFGDLKC